MSSQANYINYMQVPSDKEKGTAGCVQPHARYMLPTCLMLADQPAQCTCAVPSTFKPTYPLPSLGGAHNLSELLVLTRCRGNSCYNSLPWCSSFPYLFLLHYLPNSGIPFLLISLLSSYSRTAYIYCMHSLNPYAICCITTGQGTLSSS